MTDVKQSGRGSGKEQFGEELQHLMAALGDRVLSSANDKVGGLSEKLSGLGNGAGGPVAKAGEKVAEGKSPMRAGLAAAGEKVKDTVSQAFGGGGGGKDGKGGKKTKSTNIIEQIDIGAPIRLVYDQWTQFQDFSNFMKKVEGVDQKEDQKLEFKAQVFWSHRTWQATIVEQVPDSRIIWRSSGDKGRVDGAVTFHELTPELTRVLVVLEYHPQGLFERTGNLWRAQGRRARLELKHFRRHVMTQTLLHPDEIEGWRGEIHDSDVAKSDEDARAEEDQDGQDGQDGQDDASEDEYDDEDELTDEDDDYDEDDEDEDDEYDDEEDDDAEDDELTDEDDDYDEDDEQDDDEGEDDEADDDEAQDEDEAPRQRRASRSSSRRPARAGRR